MQSSSPQISLQCVPVFQPPFKEESVFPLNCRLLHEQASVRGKARLFSVLYDALWPCLLFSEVGHVIGEKKRKKHSFRVDADIPRKEKKMLPAEEAKITKGTTCSVESKKISTCASEPHMLFACVHTSPYLSSQPRLVLHATN